MATLTFCYNLSSNTFMPRGAHPVCSTVPIELIVNALQSRYDSARPPSTTPALSTCFRYHYRQSRSMNPSSTPDDARDRSSSELFRHSIIPHMYSAERAHLEDSLQRHTNQYATMTGAGNITSLIPALRTPIPRTTPICTR